MDQPLNVIMTEDGSHTVYSKLLKVGYHSLFGAIDESIHVFITAGLEKCLLQHPQRISILEYGFGTGLNAYLSFLKSTEYPDINFSYHGLEAYPLHHEIIEKLNYTDLLNVSYLKKYFKLMHQSPWENAVCLNDNFSFLKNHTKFELAQLSEQYDIIYYDAFAPNAQPELWTDYMMEKLRDNLKIGGILVTYCAKGTFKRALKKLGFLVESLPGPGKKREMTRARKDV